MYTLEDACFNSHYGNTPSEAIDAWEPAMDRYKDTKRWRHETPAFVKLRQDSIDTMLQSLRTRDLQSLADRCKLIDEQFAVSRQFLNDIHHFQQHEVLPGETLPGQMMPDGKMKPLNKVAPSADLFKQITKGLSNNKG
jgi:hypothetical protein